MISAESATRPPPSAPVTAPTRSSVPSQGIRGWSQLIHASLVPSGDGVGNAKKSAPVTRTRMALGPGRRVGGRAVERDRDDRPVHLHAAAGVEPGLRPAVVRPGDLPHAPDLPAVGGQGQVGEPEPGPVRRQRRRFGRASAPVPAQPVKALVGEVREDEIEPAGLVRRRHRQVRPAAVLVHPGAGVPRGGQQLARLVGGTGRGHDRDPPALGRAALLPPHLLAREGREPDLGRSPRHVGGADRRLPGSIGSDLSHGLPDITSGPAGA